MGTRLLFFCLIENVSLQVLYRLQKNPLPDQTCSVYSSEGLWRLNNPHLGLWLFSRGVADYLRKIWGGVPDFVRIIW